MATVRKVISGGQTGADRGALEGAKEAGILTGGHVPKGFRTEAGSDPTLRTFGVIELGTTGYPSRTSLNVLKSDATIAFAAITDTPGEVLTKEMAKKYRKPYICINPFDKTALSQFQQWLAEVQPVVLNVAGNAESKVPGIQDRVKTLVKQAFTPAKKTRRRKQTV